MHRLLSFTALCASLGLVAGQQLAFTAPTKLDPSVHALNSKVNVTWTSPFDQTNLEVWQGPRTDGSFAIRTLLKNASQDTNSFTWKAEPLDNMDFEPPFHFRLQKGDGDNLCDGCEVNSEEFSVVNVGANDNSVLSNGQDSGHGLSGQSKLMIGLSIGIAVAVISAFVTLVCCTKRDKPARSSQRKPKKRARTPISMMFRGYVDQRGKSKDVSSDRVGHAF